MTRSGLCAFLGASAIAITASAQEKASLAVAPFTVHRDVRALPAAELETNALTQKFVTALAATRKFDVVERARIDQLLAEMELSEAGLTDPARAVEAGKLLGADFFLMGEVAVYTLSTNVKPIPHTQRFLRNEELTLIVDMRIVDTRTSRVVAAERGEVTRRGRQEFRHKPAAEDCVAPATLDALERELVQQLVLKVIDGIYPIKIIRVNPNGQVVLNRGQGGGLSSRDLLDVFETGAELVDPDTGEVLGNEETKVARIEVTQVLPRFTKADCVAGMPQVGNICRPASGKAEFGPRPQPDTTAPQVDVLSPYEGVVTQAGQIEVVVMARDEKGVTRVTIAGQEAQSVGGDRYQAVVALEEGHVRLSALAWDAAGNQGRAERLLLSDRTPPDVVWESPGPEVVHTTPRVEVVACVADKHGVARVDIAGQPAEETSPGFWKGWVVAEGAEQHVVIRAWDVAGNVGRAKGVLRFDRRGPKVTIESPRAGTLLRESPVEVVALVEDDGRVAEVKIGSRPAQPLGGGRWKARVEARAGHNTVEVEARDSAGNHGSASAEFFCDLAPPGLLILSPEPDSLVGSKPVLVCAFAYDDNGLASVEVGGKRAFRNPWNGLYYAQVSHVQPGSNEVQVTATDQAGNTSWESATFRFDATPPTIQVLAPRAASTLSNNPVRVVVDVQDEGGVARVTIGRAEAKQDDKGRWRAQIEAQDGANSVAISAWDRGGNRTQATASFSFDATPPMVEAEAAILVEGTVDDLGATLTINGVKVEYDRQSGRYSVRVPPDPQDPSRVTIVAADEFGNQTTEVRRIR